MNEIRSTELIGPTSRLNSRAWLTIHLVTLLIGFGVLLALNWHAWFIADEWDMIVRATQPLTLHALFVPHNEHWSTIPILTYRLLVDLFGLRSYVPYICVLLLAHLLLAHLLWRLIRQVGGSDLCATVLAAIFVVLGAGAQNVTNAFQLSFVLSVVAGVAATLLVNVDEPVSMRRQIGTVALLVLGLSSSGIGITMTAFAGLAVYLRHGYRMAWRLVVIPITVYAVWFAAIGHSSLSSDRISIDTVSALPQYVWTGFTASVTSLDGVPESGGAIVLGILAYAIWKSGDGMGRRSPAFAGVLSVIVLYVTAGLVRTSLGSAQAASTRYSYVAIALLLPIFALGVSDMHRFFSRPFGLLLTTVLVLMILGNSVAELRTFAHILRPAEEASQNEIFAAALLARGHANVANVPSAELHDQRVNQADLRTIVEDGLLPKVLHVDEMARLDAETTFQTASTASALTPTRPNAIRLVTVGGTRVVPDANDCVSASKASGAPVSFDTVEPTALKVLPPSGTIVSIQLSSGGAPLVAGSPATLAMSPTRPTYIDLLGTRMHVKLRFTNPVFKLCGFSHQ
jgi:hypothetical protein